MSWSYSDEIDAREYRARSRGCPACRGLGYVPHRGAGNSMASDPCGCDEPDDGEDFLEDQETSSTQSRPFGG